MSPAPTLPVLSLRARRTTSGLRKRPWWRPLALVILALAGCAPLASQDERLDRPADAGGSIVEPEIPAVTSYLHLVLRVDADGRIEPLSVTRMDGEAVTSPIIKSDYLLEVRLDDRTLSVESPPDPFEAHSFGDPPGAGHHRQPLESAELTVKIPATDFTSEHLDRLAIRLLAIEPGSDLSTVDAEVLAEADARGLLETVAETGGPALADWIRAHRGGPPSR